jgi:glycerophosphoryl diester phosphodiesterase
MPRHLTTTDATTFVPTTDKGAVNGVAQLDGTGKVPTAQLPASVSTGVSSVNGFFGNVVLVASDVSADPVGAAASAQTAAATNAGSQIATHAAAVDPHADRAYTVTQIGVHAAAADPHGDRANTTSQISTHSAAADPHGDRANTTTQIATHSGAADPHGDRAYAVTNATSQIATHSAAVDPHGDRAYADGASVPQAVVTVDQLLANNPFYVAHRGSGGEYPEHTMMAYSSSVGLGAQAIEVSVNCTVDGVLFCMHDTTLDRMTNGTWTGSNATWTWAALNQRAKVVGTPLLGPAWADQPIPTLREVLDRFLGKVVIFLEAKGNSAVTPLENMLLTYPGATKSVVWKAYYLANTLTWAKSHGFKVWAYADAATTSAALDAIEANVDYWGMPIEASDAQITAVVTRTIVKPVMCWEVHRRSDVTRLAALGVKGMMCAQYLYVTRSTALALTDDFSTQVKSPGNFGPLHLDPLAAMKWDTGAGANVVYLNKIGGASMTLGRFGPVVPGTNGYKITFGMMYPVLPTSTLHSGFYFGKASDDMYTFSSTSNVTSGYHSAFRGNGDMQLYTHTAGVATGTQLNTVSTATPIAGTWMTFEIEVNPTQVILRRTDGTPVTLTTATTTFRGGYFGFHNGSLTDITSCPRFRNITVVSL